MKRIELILSIFALIGIIGRSQHLPGMDLVILLTASLLSLFYFLCSIPLFTQTPVPVLLRTKPGPRPGIRISIFSFATGWIMSLTILGVMFRMMDYPGADFMILLSWGMLFPVLVIALYRNFQHPSKALGRILSRVMVLLIISSLVYIYKSI